MRLYTTLFRISLQDATQYRVESAIWFLYEVVANILGGMLIPIALLPEWLQDPNPWVLSGSVHPTGEADKV
jgi:ABC-type uncharacterized transport system permease subunit